MVFAIFTMVWIALGWLSIVVLKGPFQKKVRRVPGSSKKMSGFSVIAFVSLMGPILFILIVWVMIGAEGTSLDKNRSTKFPSKD